MTNRVFRLLELAQKIDDRLRLAQARRRPDPLEIAHLRRRKQGLRERLASLVRPAPSAMSRA